MRRLAVLLALCAATGALALVACGGSDKPPLTPDSVEPPPAESAEAGAPATPAKPK
ncbi:MAG: hypothetical protein JST00_05135 [Deltaproteobacteria bacterium]|nr:hypothetical protein [Deltaproteobacteria bacterium]